MKFLIVAQGSFGDINPCAGIALALLGRGHQVSLLTSGYYEPVLSRLGLDLVDTLTREDHLRISNHPDFRHPLKSLRFVMQEKMMGPMRREYEGIRDAYEPGQTAVLMLGFGVGARIAQDKLGVPVVTLLLYPQLMRSVYDEHGFGGNRMLPLFGRKWLRSAFDKRIDAIVAPETNRFRRELGLTGIPRHLNDWAYSPQLIVGLFPEWFSAPQPDWPRVEQAGFPIFDGSDATELEPEIEAFLRAGDPPVVVNALSGTQDAREFFERSAAAVTRLKRRAILLSPYKENIPQNLPPEVRYFGYVPHTLLLPRAAAIVHQGGIGTLAKALQAGIPQIIVPVTFDQPYNGSHVTAMGVGAMLKQREYNPENVAKKLDALLSSDSVKKRCEHFKLLMRIEDGINEACRLIEAACDPARAGVSKGAATP